MEKDKEDAILYFLNLPIKFQLKHIRNLFEIFSYENLFNEIESTEMIDMIFNRLHLIIHNSGSLDLLLEVVKLCFFNEAGLTRKKMLLEENINTLNEEAITKFNKITNFYAWIHSLAEERFAKLYAEYEPTSILDFPHEIIEIGNKIISLYELNQLEDFSQILKNLEKNQLANVLKFLITNYLAQKNFKTDEMENFINALLKAIHSNSYIPELLIPEIFIFLSKIWPNTYDLLFIREAQLNFTYSFSIQNRDVKITADNHLFHPALYLLHRMHMSAVKRLLALTKNNNGLDFKILLNLYYKLGDKRLIIEIIEAFLSNLPSSKIYLKMIK